MKPLDDRSERFAQLLHAGTPLMDAFEEAGYSPDRGNAKRAHKRIRPRLRELAGLPPVDDGLPDIATTPVHWRPGAFAFRLDDAERLGKAGISRETIIGLQVQILEAAIKAGNTTAANAGVKQLAQLQGMWVERSEAKQIIEKAEDDPKRIARAILDVIERHPPSDMIDVTPGTEG